MQQPGEHRSPPRLPVQKRHPETMTKDLPHIVLVAAGWPQLIYLAEALSQRGLHVVLVGVKGQFDNLPKIDALEAHSVTEMTPSTLAPVLQRICARQAPKYIVPLTDDAIQCCGALPAEFQPWLFPQFTAEQLGLMGDKARMSAKAQALGLRIPAFLQTDLPDEALRFAEGVGYPVMVKGATGTAGCNVRLVANPTELLTALKALAHDQPTVQQYVSGVTLLAGGLFDNGRPLRLQLCEKTLMHPAVTGPSVKVRSLTLEPLRHDFLALCAGLGWTGFASTDFIWDGKDLYFLELNPRPWGAITTAPTAGPEIFEVFAAQLLGEPVPPDLRLRKDVDAFVFPSYLFYAVNRGGWAMVLWTLLRPGFWRSVPRSWPLFVYFMRCTLWARKSHTKKAG